MGSDKEESAVDVLDFEFFDDDLMVLVLKLTDSDRKGRRLVG